MNGYKTYRFRGKDPVIGLLREAIAFSGLSFKEVADISGVSLSTLYNWFNKNGKTMLPRYAGVQAVARAVHHELRLHRGTSSTENVIFPTFRRRKAA